MKARMLPVIVGLVGLLAVQVQASGQAGVYGVLERVVFEPASGDPQRIQLWGAFMLVEHLPGQGFTGYPFGPPARGYMYFTLPEDRSAFENTRREWADLKSVAGTRQAVAFAYWDRLRGMKILRIRDSATKPEDPDIYYTNVGVTKLNPAGSHRHLIEGLLNSVPR